MGTNPSLFSVGEFELKAVWCAVAGFPDCSHIAELKLFEASDAFNLSFQPDVCFKAPVKVWTWRLGSSARVSGTNAQTHKHLNKGLSRFPEHLPIRPSSFLNELPSLRVKVNWEINLKGVKAGNGPQSSKNQEIKQVNAPACWCDDLHWCLTPWDYELETQIRPVLKCSGFLQLRCLGSILWIKMCYSVVLVGLITTHLSDKQSLKSTSPCTSLHIVWACDTFEMWTRVHMGLFLCMCVCVCSEGVIRVTQPHIWGYKNNWWGQLAWR